jgi:hypothetical protein
MVRSGFYPADWTGAPDRDKADDFGSVEGFRSRGWARNRSITDPFRFPGESRGLSSRRTSPCPLAKYCDNSLVRGSGSVNPGFPHGSSPWAEGP